MHTTELPQSAARARAILDAWNDPRSGHLTVRLAAAAALPTDAEDAAEEERLELLGSIASRLLANPADGDSFVSLIRRIARPELPA